MLNLSRNSNYANDLAHSEIGDYSMLNRHQKPRLPRHISVLESRSHSSKTPDLIQPIRKCPLKQQLKNGETIGAIDILQYQLQDSAAQRQHRQNLRSNLMHRLQVAKSANDSQLVALLKAEFEQLQVNI